VIGRAVCPLLRACDLQLPPTRLPRRIKEALSLCNARDIAAYPVAYSPPTDTTCVFRRLAEPSRTHRRLVRRHRRRHTSDGHAYCEPSGSYRCETRGARPFPRPSRLSKTFWMSRSSSALLTSPSACSSGIRSRSGATTPRTSSTPFRFEDSDAAERRAAGGHWRRGRRLPFIGCDRYGPQGHLHAGLFTVEQALAIYTSVYVSTRFSSTVTRRSGCRSARR
jgi:hypothetical protein